MIERNKKIFHHDLVALALACVVSLLFTNRVAEFFSHTSKKQDHYRASIFFPVQNEFTEDECLILTPHLQTPIEKSKAAFSPIEIIPSTFRFQRFAGFAAVKTETLACRPDHGYSGQHFNYTLPVGWSPSISIVQRKLII